MYTLWRVAYHTLTYTIVNCFPNVTRALAVSAPQNSNRETFRWDLRLNDICTEHFVCLIKHKFFLKHTAPTCAHTHNIAEQVDYRVERKMFSKALIYLSNTTDSGEIVGDPFLRCKREFLVRFGESMQDVFNLSWWLNGLSQIIFCLQQRNSKKIEQVIKTCAHFFTIIIRKYGFKDTP